jgi:MtfA peptidase
MWPFRRRHRGLNNDDLKIIARVVPGWATLDEAGKAGIVQDTATLMRDKRWEAANGFDLTDQMRVHIAAQAALLILELPYDMYHRVHSIIVHPTRMVRDGVRQGPVAGVVSSGPMTIVGEAAHGTGPVVLAWDSVQRQARHPAYGNNVVLHEFAHKIDMLDNLADGVPPIGDPTQLRRWKDVSAAAFKRIRTGDDSGLLRNYAATNPGEFFAVTTEAFFTTPLELLEGEPDVYGVLRSFYRQDPAARSS